MHLKWPAQTVIAFCQLVLCLAALLFSAGAWSAAGTVVGNIATATFQINTVSFTVESSPTGNITPGIGNGTNTVFTIDNRINFTINLEDSNAIEVIAGQTNALLTFRLTNNGNAIQDFVLSALNTSANPFATPVDSIDISNINVYVENGANAGFQITEDDATFVDGLPFDPAGGGNEAIIYVVAEIPNANVDDVAAIALVAQVAESPDTGADGLQGAIINTDDSATPNALNTVQIVFADPAGANPEDIDSSGVAQDSAFNGQAADAGAFVIVPPAISIVKSVAILNSIDGTAHAPVLSTGDPGATLRYTIDVVLSGTDTISNLIITDPIPANTSYVTESIVLDGVAQTDADNTLIDFSNFNVTASDAIAVDISQGGSITPPKSYQITFDVTID